MVVVWWCGGWLGCEGFVWMEGLVSGLEGLGAWMLDAGCWMVGVIGRCGVMCQGSMDGMGMEDWMGGIRRG
jgi:hypothetical protein